MQAPMSHPDDLPRRYRLFILGVWTQPARQPGCPPAWRISLENPRTAECKGFADLAELVVHLTAWMADQATSGR